MKEVGPETWSIKNEPVRYRFLSVVLATLLQERKKKAETSKYGEQVDFFVIIVTLSLHASLPLAVILGGGSLRFQTSDDRQPASWYSTYTASLLAVNTLCLAYVYNNVVLVSHK